MDVLGLPGTAIQVLVVWKTTWYSLTSKSMYFLGYHRCPRCSGVDFNRFDAGAGLL